MANSLKNISALLSPRFRTPLTPTKSLLGTPRSDGKLYHPQHIRSNVVKKLTFIDTIKPKFPKDVLKSTSIVPDIKIDKVLDVSRRKEVDDRDETHFSSKSSKIIDINTPNKLDLGRNGLENFKNCTRVLGKGTFGTVFKGNHRGETVAVKIVKDCLREKNALNLNHQNIVKTLEIIRNSEHETYCLIIMEHLENCRNLQDVIDNFHSTRPNSFMENPTELLKKFCLDITCGLDYCHNKKVLHLDLKPKNILVDVENVCKICDFGNSVIIDENLDSFTHRGTIRYTAPEILLGFKPTTKSDVYSLGIVFWQLKYRKNPFSSYDTNESIIYNVGKFNARPSYEKGCADSFMNIFTKCWQSDPELRPNTAEVLKTLKEAVF